MLNNTLHMMGPRNSYTEVQPIILQHLSSNNRTTAVPSEFGCKSDQSRHNIN
jgi:hypothetical protein